MRNLQLAATAVVAVLLVATATGGAGNALSAIPPRTKPPRWLLARQLETLHAVFGDAKPVHVDYLFYPRKVAVVFDFGRIVICGACSGPTRASVPRGKVIRVSFDRQTHQLGDAMRFCSSRRACLYR